MTLQSVVQLLGVVVGGLLAIAGGILTTTLLEKQRHRQESRNLALAFKGEITALIELIKERRYLQRFEEVIRQIEATGQPFFMPFRIRFKYDRVYESNVNRIGLLKPPLPETVPLFYTRLASILEDMVSLGDGTYSQMDIERVLHIYRDSSELLQLTVTLGQEILEVISSEYNLKDRPAGAMGRAA